MTAGGAWNNYNWPTDDRTFCIQLMKDLHLAYLNRWIVGGLSWILSTILFGTVVPNFTRGTVTSETSTKTTVVETIRQIDYTTGESTVTGMNINIPSNPGPDTEIFNSNTWRPVSVL